MSYSPEIFNRYKAMVDESGSHLIRSIMYLLKPTDGYTAFSNAVIQERYTVWQADCRAMDAACNQTWSDNQSALVMPPDDEEHLPCRMMAAVLIERAVYGEHTARHNLIEAIKFVRANLDTCSKHPPSCPCRNEVNCKWTYDNKKLVEHLGRDIDIKRRGDLAAFTSIGGAPGSAAHVHKCACGKCHDERVRLGTQDAYMAELRAETDKVLAKYSVTSAVSKPMDTLLVAANKADDAIAAARTMPGGSLDEGFVKNLFKTVQGVNYDDKCPHSLPYYACMSCSH